MQRKAKVNDPDDFSLNAGHGYFANDTDFREYIHKIERDKPVDYDKPVGVNCLGVDNAKKQLARYM